MNGEGSTYYHRKILVFCYLFFFFQAEDGIRDLVRSRGLGDVYKRQRQVILNLINNAYRFTESGFVRLTARADDNNVSITCLLYTSDAADDLLRVDLGGRRIIKKNTHYQS